ncbi:MAG: hypothetical protein LBO06_01455 [Bacteroidales bacterium]|jgi:N-acetylglucosamine kinase-like BadF-type ATPase|nr:hypothetical protein [Bacteroidales bacterium]
MILIADSGATKADWCLVNDKQNKKYFSSRGMNPYNITVENMKTEIETEVLPHIDAKRVDSLLFYGSGCGAESKKREMQEVFETYFPTAQIEIEHDLLGAARATCGRRKGICAILGTGSNSCLYDGENIVENVPALGYVLCDEGAGTNIGKLLLKNYLRGLMPKEVTTKFAQQYPGDESDFLNRLYKGEIPNYYLASFAKFAMDNQDNAYLKRIIVEAFESFLENQITKYSDYDKILVNVVGSIGFLAREIFKEVANNYDVKVGRVIQSPLEELVNYHLE